MVNWYKEDLAYIHDVGFSDYALKSAPGILEILNKNRINLCHIHNSSLPLSKNLIFQTGCGSSKGLVIDLGCGSGLWAQELTKAGYQVVGIDISEPMIDIARKRVPDAEFVVGSLFKVEIPPCNAVTSIGECLNYLFDPNNNHQKLVELFGRIYNSLTPGGVFIFDLLEPGQLTQGNVSKSFTEGKDWVVLVEKEEDRQQGTLTRRIITFRRMGKYYKRDDEIHQVQLYKAEYITQELHRVGFQVQIVHSFGQYNLPKAHAAFVALKTIAPES